MPASCRSARLGFAGWPFEPFGPGWTLWQYHDRGGVDGIEGDVDLNVFAGGPEALAALVQ